MSQPRDLSIADLRQLMLDALESGGHSPDWIAGYIAAQERSGWLRPSCPAWIRNSAGVFYAIPPASGFANPGEQTGRR